MKNDDRILDAALNVVRKHTISGTRMHLIAEEAGMLQSNVHYYYKTKDDLMFALQKKVLQKCLDIRDDLFEKSEDTLEASLDVFIEQKKLFITSYDEYDFAEIDFWVQGHVNDEIKRGFSKSFEGWRKDLRKILEKYEPSLSKEKKEMLPAIIVSYLEGATIQYLIDKDSIDIDEYFKFGKQMILDSIVK